MKDSGPSGFGIFKLGKPLDEATAALGWAHPTEIQQKTIPLVKAGKDVLGIAQTGTGKTAAYLLPLMAKLHYPQGNHCRAVILAPTRELVAQIVSHFEQLNTELGLRCATLIGGVGLTGQLARITEGTDLVVATPGRFLEMYATNQWNTKDIRTLVIDEADRMMDMGFMPQIRLILEKIPTKRQNLLFSATFPARVEGLAAEFLEFPERVEITPQATPAGLVTQAVIRTRNFQTKLNVLLHLLKKIGADDAAIVFVKTKQNATEIGKFLDRKLALPVAFLHANKGTNTRAAALTRLREGEINVLVTTDVAARGLDIPQVSLVVNVDLPIQYEEYVHRIGRTGRAQRPGQAISFVNAPDQLHLERIEKLIRAAIPEMPIPPGLEVEHTPYDEEQDMLKRIDEQRKKADPSFKGAFHEKKAKNKAPIAPKKKTGEKAKPKKAGTSATQSPQARQRGKAFKPGSPVGKARRKRGG